ncbi:hypothetical protein GCM10007962_15790 [Yeosuana aromativorans]|uniref:DUF5777 domain-containing protein n=1 Tax=Yeosuana aromativorans TaxID=288019 RepID=A0A8J3BHH4_9FLAO|nr:DUF5777 family beta-barrel protein [Yeosuana aromativorans]GGK22462.1 hypothetical protein GCM10007962_15790 [Yeosuana aromativorans]
MKNYKILLFTFLILPLFTFSQEEVQEKVVDKPERPAFESSTLVDNQTNVLFNKNTLEVMMQHRFGPMDYQNTLLGIYGSSNIRIGFSYAILDWVTVGYGITKSNITSDFSLKAGILQQTRSGRIPLSLTYYGNVAIDGRSGDANDGVFLTRQDRYSYFHQLIIARRFTPNFSFQIAPSLSHYNTVDYGYVNDRFSIAFGGRYKISPQTSIIVDYSQPITSFDEDSYNNPGLSFGVEFSTSAHVFQLFLTNYNGIVQQQNYMRNTNDFFSNHGALIGFNITRRYNF